MKNENTHLIWQQYILSQIFIRGDNENSQADYEH